MSIKDVGYRALSDNFCWSIPEYYNIGIDVCDKWAEADPDRLALLHNQDNNNIIPYTFGDIRDFSNQVARLLNVRGINKGDRVGILLPQTPETAISHVSIYKIGAIAVPLFMLFGEEALAYRLKDCGAKAVITDSSGFRKLNVIRKQLTDLQTIFTIDSPLEDCVDFHQERKNQETEFTPLQTSAEDPALIIYTSGTTGQPKGALHAHRVLLGHLPGVDISHNFFPQEGDLIWTPADWAWIGGLLDVLMPAWHHGVPVVAHRFEKFDPEAAFKLISELGIRNLFLPPTALKIMRSATGQSNRPQMNLRSIASGGESLGSELLDWCIETFGVPVNEFYGQTECNMVVSSCSELFETKPSFMGKPVPGHQLSVVDDDGKPVTTGELGNIAVSRPDPVMFLEYWNKPEATKDKFIGDWLITGDKGYFDDEGYVCFVGRTDDIITSAGYRIGPGEIENCLLGHPAVTMAAVVGIPDPERTQIVKAFIQLEEGYIGNEQLKKGIQQYVKIKLAAYEYPREIEFVKTLPMTNTGKIIRRALRDNLQSVNT